MSGKHHRAFNQVISKNEYTRIAQDFCSFSRRKNGCIASYVTLFTTQIGTKRPASRIYYSQKIALTHWATKVAPTRGI